MIAEMGHIFGCEDIYHDRYYTTSLRCYSKSGILLKIKSEDFLEFIKKDETIYQKFVDISLQRNLNTMNKIR